MKIELDLDKTYNQPAEDNQVLNLIDGPVHLIELSKTNVQRLVDIAHEVFTHTHTPSYSLKLSFSLTRSTNPIE
jgi:hypothetical protein